jgi:hypothetical protein
MAGLLGDNRVGDVVYHLVTAFSHQVNILEYI